MDYNLPQLLKTLVEQGASDLHITANSAPRLRVDGKVVPLNLPPLSADECSILAMSVLTEEQKKYFETNREIDLSFSVKNLARFRANIFHQLGKTSAAFRLIPHKIKSLEELRMPSIFKDFANLSHGLILVTGPTGSGKSTTLAAMVDYINSNRNDHIITIEDPIEFLHQHNRSIINQREVGSDTLSFQNALRASLRQDPDVIVLGEMRDYETISIALTTAETGHLVLGTLHTNDTVSSINRLIDVFPAESKDQARTQLAMILKGVVAQTLVPTIGGGRVCAQEIMAVNPAIKALILEGKVQQIYSNIQSGQAESGMTTLNQSLSTLYRKRLITIEDALKHSTNQEELLDIINRKTKAGRR